MKIRTNYGVSLLALLYLFTLHASQEKPILCLFYTPSHEILYKEWLGPSIQDDVELAIGTAPQDCPEASYYKTNWTVTTKKKVEHIVKTIQNNIGRFFIFSDVDIQFFGPIVNDLRALLNNYDMIIQRDSPAGHICSGFFAFVCTEKILQLWKAVLNHIVRNPQTCDQWALFKVLIVNKFPINWTYLPDRYFGGGSLTGKHWKPGDQLPIPDDILIHHANWCSGIPKKIKQLEYVKDVVEQRKKQ